MFMGGKGKHAPQNITHVSIDESVEEIATDTFNKCKILDEVIIHGNVLRIKEEAFNICPSLRIRGSILLCLWRWVLKKQVKCSIRFIPSNVVKLLDESFSEYSTLDLTDIDLLRQALTLSRPPMDLIDEILDFLHSRDVLLSRIPRDLILNVLLFL